MINHNQDGVISGVVVSLILTVLLLCGAVGFGAWAFSQRQDYKNNVDNKIAIATEAARQAESTAKAKEFAEKDKQPLQTYNGPEAYGSVVIMYPKTWSGYVDSSGTSQALVDGYFSPGVVPSITDANSAFALRVEVSHQPYAQVLDTFKSQQQSGKVTIDAYALPKLPKIVGVKVTGQLTGDDTAKTTTMVVLPLRSDTLKIYTEGNQYLNDFNTYVLPNFSFSP